MPSRRTDIDHVGAYNFKVEIGGVAAGYFKGVDGLSAELEVIEFQDGDDLTLRKRPGRAKFGDVTLKKGYIVTADLQEWWRQAREGQYTRRDISIILNDNAGNAIRTWFLCGCWPKAWKVSALDGKGNDVVTEELTFVVENMQIGG
ncbi:MAG: phage tail protein [Proteobacteria bacterium]|nr:phage tail protein [Pseudomonadota bacterium]